VTAERSAGTSNSAALAPIAISEQSASTRANTRWILGGLGVAI
jgi:hypothetical protein